MYKLILTALVVVLVTYVASPSIGKATPYEVSPLEEELEVCNDLYKLSRGVFMMKEDGMTHEQFNENIITSNFTTDEMGTMLKLGEIIYDGFTPSQIFQSCAMNAYREHGRQL